MENIYPQGANIYHFWKTFIFKEKYLSFEENIYLYGRGEGKIIYPGENIFSSGEINVFRRDNIYPQMDKYFPGETNFDPISKKNLKNRKKL
jgi:hypothetical protein